jgi:hypothetical protein
MPRCRATRWPLPPSRAAPTHRIPGFSIAAGLVARKARALGPEGPCMGQDVAQARLSRGSRLPRARRTDRRPGGRGLRHRRLWLHDLHRQPGPLPLVIQEAQAQGAIHPVAILSGNRNFPGRVHPDLDLGFLMSPPLVIAFGLAGDAERRFQRRTGAGRRRRHAGLPEGPVAHQRGGRGGSALGAGPGRLSARVRCRHRESAVARPRSTGHAAFSLGLRSPLPCDVRHLLQRPKAACWAHTARTRCWWWATTSRPTTSPPPARSPRTAWSPTSSWSAATTATT